jgi:diaminohydroxyphosphoribosylaminopyrimidine deaminase/5-amino-6-(5-phosphoribosylamino)uracil reductase
MAVQFDLKGDTVNHREMMKLAVKVAKNSAPEPGRVDPTPTVGAVMGRDGQLLGSVCRGETGPGDHAEFGLIRRCLDGIDLSGAVLYTTLEPCTIRGDEKKKPCVSHIIKAGVKEVFIGLIDPNRDIQGDGYWLLREKGVNVSFFDSDL